jgi:hypothetical protein
VIPSGLTEALTVTAGTSCCSVTEGVLSTAAAKAICTDPISEATESALALLLLRYAAAMSAVNVTRVLWSISKTFLYELKTILSNVLFETSAPD